MPASRDPETGQFLPSNPNPEPASAAPPIETPAAPATEKPAKGAKKPDADDSGLNALAEAFLGDSRAVPPGKKQKPEAKPVAAATAKPPVKPVPAKPATAATGLTKEELADAVGEGVARAMPKPAADKKPDAAAAPELSASDKRKVAVLTRLSELQPDKYKDIAKRYQDSVVALAEYAQKWEQAHPGETFDEAAAEHEEFFKQHDVDWDDEDYTDAQADIKAEERVAGTKKELDSRLSEIERQGKLREATATIATEQTTAAQRLWKALGDDFADVVKPDGSVDATKLKAMQEADPDAFNVRLRAAQALDLEVAELYKVMNGLAPFITDPPKEGSPDFPKKMIEYRVHQAISQFASQCEQRMMQQAEADRTNKEGKFFLPAAEYWKLPKAKREAHWTFSHQDFAAMRASELARNANAFIEAEEEKFKERAARMGIKLDEETPARTHPPAVEDETPPDNTDDKPNSPTLTTMPKSAATRESRTPAPQSGVTSFIERGL